MINVRNIVNNIFPIYHKICYSRKTVKKKKYYSFRTTNKKVNNFHKEKWFSRIRSREMRVKNEIGEWKVLEKQYLFFVCVSFS